MYQEEISELERARRIVVVAADRAAATVEKIKEWVASFLGLRVETMRRYDDPQWVDYAAISPTDKPVWTFALVTDVAGNVSLYLSKQSCYVYGGRYEWIEELETEIKKLNRAERSVKSSEAIWTPCAF